MPERTWPIGDAALLVEVGSRIDTALNSRCHALAAALEKRSGVREAFAGYASVTVHYDPERTSYSAPKAAIGKLLGAETRVGPRPIVNGRGGTPGGARSKGYASRSTGPVM